MSGEKPPVEICKGVNGLGKVVLREVYLYGGHVTSWKNDHGEELLFLSTKALVLASIISWVPGNQLDLYLYWKQVEIFVSAFLSPPLFFRPVKR